MVYSIIVVTINFVVEKRFTDYYISFLKQLTFYLKAG